MTARSQRGRDLLARYRSETALRPEERSRALRGLQQRLAAGVMPPAYADVPAPEPARRATPNKLLLARVLASTLGVVGLGVGVTLWSPTPTPTTVVPPLAAAGTVGGAAVSPPPTPRPTMATGDALPVAQSNAPRMRARAHRAAAQSSAPTADALSAVAVSTAPIVGRALPLPAVAVSQPAVAAPLPPRAEAAQLSAAARVPERSAPPEVPRTLAQEMQLMEAAHIALRRGDTRRAPRLQH